jgi:hypothetical protein
MQKIKIKKADLVKFLSYFIIFFLLFFWYNKTNSPTFIWDFNSASIYSQEEKKIIWNEGFLLWEKKQEKPYLSISFKPDYIKIDNNLIKILDLNIKSKYFKDKVTPISLVIDWERTDPRWQVSGNNLILTSKAKIDSETIKVFVHELGHIVDIYYLTDNAWLDKSEDFYKISWLAYNIKNKNAKITDFVSGYSLSNKYEDFAESFVFYIFHNEEFLCRSLSNYSLKLKYNFFKNYVFNSNEFKNTTFWSGSIATYNWDSTKIWINLKKYLYYIR